MLHKAWNSKGEMPYCFPRSSVKFQGHTVQNITDFDPNWAFPDYRPVAAFKSLRFALFLAVWPWNLTDDLEQGKSEGFESCDRPIVRKRPIWVKIGDVLSRVTLKFDGWPWKTIGHLFFGVSSFVQHFIAIGEFKLELQSGNAQFESNSTIFRAMSPWNLMDDLEKQQGTSSMLLQALCIIS